MNKDQCMVTVVNNPLSDDKPCPNRKHLQTTNLISKHKSIFHWVKKTLQEKEKLVITSI